MKRLGCFSLFALLTFSYALSAHPLLPSTCNMVNDSAHLFTPEANARIEGILRAYRDSTTREILVVTVNDFDGYDLNSFATELRNQWGIGKRDVNDGIIVLLRASNMPAIPLTPSLDSEWATARDAYITQGYHRLLYAFFYSITNDSLYAASKSSRPEGYYGEGCIATGQGIEGTLSDVLAAQIMRSVVAPFFAAQRYAEGTEAGLYAIFQALAGHTATISETLTSNTQNEDEDWWILLCLFILIFFVWAIIKGLGRLFLQSLGHVVTYLTSKEVRNQYSFMTYWRCETLKSVKRIIRG